MRKEGSFVSMKMEWLGGSGIGSCKLGSLRKEFFVPVRYGSASRWEQVYVPFDLDR